MITFLPLPGGFIKLAERFVDPAFAFATGWNYWYQWTVRLAPSNLVPSLILGRRSPYLVRMIKYESSATRY